MRGWGTALCPPTPPVCTNAPEGIRRKRGGGAGACLAELCAAVRALLASFTSEVRGEELKLLADYCLKGKCSKYNGDGAQRSTQPAKDRCSAQERAGEQREKTLLSVGTSGPSTSLVQQSAAGSPHVYFDEEICT